MPKEFAEWWERELAEPGLSQRGLAVRGGIASPAVSQIVHGSVQPAAESIVRIAISLGEDPVALLGFAGILPDVLPETTGEEEAVRILRALPYHLRQVAIWVLRGIHAEHLRGNELGTLQAGDWVHVVLVQEGRLRGRRRNPITTR